MFIYLHIFCLVLVLMLFCFFGMCVSVFVFVRETEYGTRGSELIRRRYAERQGQVTQTCKPHACQ
jgi:hypothetical protein